jgi:hypothetical protein
VDDDHIRRLAVELGEDGKAAVGGPVVDEDHLERLFLGFETVGDLSIERLERLLLVEERNDDRKHARRVQATHVGELVSREVKRDEDADLARHLANAVTKETPDDAYLTKDRRDSAWKIHLADSVLRASRVNLTRQPPPGVVLRKPITAVRSRGVSDSLPGLRGRPRSLPVVVVAVAFAFVVGVAALGSIFQALTVTERRSELAAVPVAARPSELSWASKREARAFRVFRSRISVDDRFALVFGKGADEVFLRLLAHFFFYPAVEVSTPEDADMVVAFGDGVEPPAGIDREVVVGRAWLGRRTR